MYSCTTKRTPLTAPVEEPTQVVGTATSTATITATMYLPSPTPSPTSTPADCLWCGSVYGEPVDYITTFQDMHSYLLYSRYVAGDGAPDITFNQTRNISTYSKIVLFFDYTDTVDNTVALDSTLEIEDSYGNVLSTPFSVTKGYNITYNSLSFTSWTLTQNPSNPKTLSEILADMKVFRITHITYGESFSFWSIKVGI